MNLNPPAITCCRGLLDSHTAGVESDSLYEIEVLGVGCEVGVHLFASDVMSWPADAHIFHGKVAEVHGWVEVVRSEGWVESLLGPDSSYGRVAVEDDDVAVWVVLKERFGCAEAAGAGADDEYVDHDVDWSVVDGDRTEQNSFWEEGDPKTKYSARMGSDR